MFLVFEGVKSEERLLSAVLRITDLDVQWAPHVLGIRLESEADADVFFDDPDILEMEDVPGGFWTMDIENDDYFLDRCEESRIHHGYSRKSAKNSRKS